MSWWNAKYKNDHDEYEITFGSQDYEKAKAVEKVCCAVIDKTVKSRDDVAIVRHGKWSDDGQCSECGEFDNKDPYGSKYCHNCWAKMDKEE